MKRLREKKRAARNRRMMRLDLVHAAGCTKTDCVVYRAVREEFGFEEESRISHLRVPRSIARIWAARRAALATMGTP